MASYPKPKHGSIFIYQPSSGSGGNSSGGSGSVIQPSVSITDAKMNTIALNTNYSSVFSSYPWLPSPNKKPIAMYLIWVDDFYGDNYITKTADPIDPSTLVYQWKDLLMFIMTGVDNPPLINVYGFSTIRNATPTLPIGVQCTTLATLVRPVCAFIVTFTGTVTNGCITFECGTFKMSLQADMSVIYYDNGVQIAQSVPLGSKDINVLGFSYGSLIGSEIIQTTDTKSYTREDVISPPEYTFISNNSMPTVSLSGDATWSFRNDIVITGLNLYDSLSFDNLVYESFLAYDNARVRCDPPIWF